MLAQPSILYVEDSHLSRTVMEILLRDIMKLQHVTIFEDSSNFATRIHAIEPKPDIIFLDIHMEPIDGFEMLSILHETEVFQDTPIIALTASVMNEEIEMLRTVGFSGCIAKPIDKDRFPRLLEQALRGEPVWNIFH